MNSFLSAVSSGLIVSISSGVFHLFISPWIDKICPIKYPTSMTIRKDINIYHHHHHTSNPSLSDQINDRVYNSSITFSILTITMLYLALYIPSLIYHVNLYGIASPLPVFSIELIGMAFGLYFVVFFLTNFFSNIWVLWMNRLKIKITRSNIQQKRYFIFMAIVIIIAAIRTAIEFEIPITSAFLYTGAVIGFMMLVCTQSYK